MSIDWKKQWELHAPNYRNGYVHMAPKGCEPFRLLPGPGFGDNSHPTTQLMLELMPSYVKGRHVIDVGCGSGILSIAAAQMGALSVHGIDICPLALDHARKNAALNDLSISFSTTYHTNRPSVYLMNMIPLEAKEALKSISPAPGSLWIISGLLVNQEPPSPPQITLINDEWKAVVMTPNNSLVD